MLWLGDARLVQRDSELPGLHVVLDAEAFVDWFRRQIPDAGIRAGRPRYVRYKPGTSCLVAYVVEWAGGSVDVTAKAYRPPALDKLGKAARLGHGRTAMGPAVVLSEELALAAVVLPYDLKLRALRHLLGRTYRKVLDGVLPGRGEQPRFRVLSYKPERRAVARVDGRGPAAIVRVYTDHDYAASAGRRIHTAPAGVRLARTLARHPRYPVTATEWLEGEEGTRAFADASRAATAGDALARLHSAPPIADRTRSADDERRHLREVARSLADLMPTHAARFEHLSGAIGECLGRLAVTRALTHGDFAARQLVFTNDGAALTDLDDVAIGHPAGDVGSFLADVDYQVLCGDLDAEIAERASSGFIEGYARVRPVPPGVEPYRAAHLLRLGPLPFRTRMPDWLARMERIVVQCESLPWRPAPASRATRRAPMPAVGREAAESDQALDAAMPWLDAALDPLRVSRLFADLPWGGPEMAVRSARVRRHKRGRRCLVEYDVARPIAQAVLGKTRSKGLDVRTARLTEALRDDGFGEGSADGIEVPPFLGVVPPLRMWLQATVAGEPSGDVLSRGHRHVARRLTDVIMKIQRRGPLPGRTHTLADELWILEGRLAALADRRPDWRERLTRLFEGCQVISAMLTDAPLVAAHRDFYHDQVLVDGSRLVLLDLDLYALAHPALDAGNCIAHLMELGLRQPTNAFELREAAGVMHDAMAANVPIDVVPAIEVLITLTLARLLEIDDRLEHRRECVEPLMVLCEERLSRAHALLPCRSSVRLAVW